MKERLSRVLEALERIALSGRDHVTVRREISSLLRRHLGFDLASWATVDPVTLAWTSCELDGLERDYDSEAAFYRNEYLQEDHLKLADLVTGEPVGTLHQATGGELERSARYREILNPLNLRDELRVALMDGESCWGCALFFREGRTFSAEEAEAISLLSRPLASALRRSMLRAAAVPEEEPEAPPGIVLTAANGRLSAMSPEAQQRLARVLPGVIPAAVPAVALRTVAGLPAQASLPSASGGWVVFRGTRLGDQVAVLVERARPEQLAEVVTRARGLTAREREIVQYVARGLSTRDMAKKLGISAWTVQDHLKATFAKVGVQSRQALIASLFFGQWTPAPEEEPPPAS